jgi:hypothetical protein
VVEARMGKRRGSWASLEMEFDLGEKILSQGVVLVVGSRALEAVKGVVRWALHIEVEWEGA